MRKIALSKYNQIRFIKGSTDDEKRFVLGIVYAPDTVDTQDDFASAEVIEAAAHDFMETAQIMKVMHEGRPQPVTIVENTIHRGPSFMIGKKKIDEGTWLIGAKINDLNLWERVKSGDFTGFSMGGKALV